MKILAIETSCDETALTLLDVHEEVSNEPHFKVLSHTVLSQIELHKEYGGVFPNLAKREHARNIVPLLEKTLRESGLHHPIPKDRHPEFISGSPNGNYQTPKQVREDETHSYENIEELLEREPEMFEALSKLFNEIEKPAIDYICVTNGPGLEPALWVGINFAKALSIAWDIPVVPVNHMEGHIVSVFANDTEFALQEPAFPTLSLLISGGHTELVLMESWGNYKKIGQTRDDAVGEAFDKVGRLLGLEYPGGPKISKLADEARKTSQHKPDSKEKTSPKSPSLKGASQDQSPTQKQTESTPLKEGGESARRMATADSRGAITLPRPMLHSDDYDFSFSGLKTAVRRLVEELGGTESLSNEQKSAIALEFENAAAEVLLTKTKRAITEHGIQTLIIAGGVAANKYIRESFEKLPHTTLLLPDMNLTGDNSLMIGVAGYFRIRAQEKDPSLVVKIEDIKAEGNLSFS